MTTKVTRYYCDTCNRGFETQARAELCEESHNREPKEYSYKGPATRARFKQAHEYLKWRLGKEPKPGLFEGMRYELGRLDEMLYGKGPLEEESSEGGGNG